MIEKGFFITLEGVDASGKTTLASRLSEHLLKQGFSLESIREPGGTEISEKVRKLLLDTANKSMHPWTEAVLYGAARRQLVEERIRPALTEGKIVLADRYVDSTLAYQGFGRGLDLGCLEDLNKICTAGIYPDLTLLLDLSPETAWRRKGAFPEDRLEKEGLTLQTRVREGYLKLAQLYSDRFKIINAGLDQEMVEKTAIYILEESLSGWKGIMRNQGNED